MSTGSILQPTNASINIHTQNVQTGFVVRAATGETPLGELKAGQYKGTEPTDERTAILGGHANEKSPPGEEVRRAMFF
jgi:hypothetical protein